MSYLRVGHGSRNRSGSTNIWKDFLTLQDQWPPFDEKKYITTVYKELRVNTSLMLQVDFGTLDRLAVMGSLLECVPAVTSGSSGYRTVSHCLFSCDTLSSHRLQSIANNTLCWRNYSEYLCFYKWVLFVFCYTRMHSSTRAMRYTSCCRFYAIPLI